MPPTNFFFLYQYTVIKKEKRLHWTAYPLVRCLLCLSSSTFGDTACPLLRCHFFCCLATPVPCCTVALLLPVDTLSKQQYPAGHCKANAREVLFLAILRFVAFVTDLKNTYFTDCKGEPPSPLFV
jgi:hypothetical protein